MFATRRLAKRSIIGTGVCAPRSDGLYQSGKIQATPTWPNGEDVYTVLFEDGYSQTYRDKDLVGPGFQNVANVFLKSGQRVYATLNGREVVGCVKRHCHESGDVSMNVVIDGDEREVYRKIEDIRLMESRKSARLLDQGDQDYSRMADLHHDSKKRPVSSVINVPTAVKQRRRKAAQSPDFEFPGHYDDIDVKMDDDSDDIMDEHQAAMVLTALSCSPKSPVLPYMTERTSDVGSFGGSSSVASSGVWGVKSGQNTPSPPHCLSQSAPTAPVFGASVDDEGINVDFIPSPFDRDTHPKRKRVAATRTVFKCTWPGCSKLCNTCPAIESHVRREHLNTSGDMIYESDNSDHEEEFYYTEVEVTMDTVTETFADMHTSSSPHDTADPLMMEEMALTALPPDHDYQKKSLPLSIPCRTSAGSESGHFASSFPSVSVAHVSKSLSWQNPQPVGGMRSTKSADKLSALTGHRNHFLSTSPKASPGHKKSRSDVKKCRKVYGMENREMWCTQCKWKKACTRFPE